MFRVYRCPWDEKYRAKYVLNDKSEYIGLDYNYMKSGICGINNLVKVGEVAIQAWPFWSAIWYHNGEEGNFETSADNWRALSTICSYGVIYNSTQIGTRGDVAICSPKDRPGNRFIPNSNSPIIPSIQRTCI
jgi:hypothetical protein